MTAAQAQGNLSKALYLYNMNRLKLSVKPETKLRHAQDVIDAAAEVAKLKATDLL